MDQDTDQIQFAVIIPTRGRLNYLRQAVESVEQQSYMATEIVVVADGFDPRVREALRETTATVIEIPSAGVASARNAGIRSTTAQWVCFLDDDDLWHPDRLSAAVEYINRNPDCAALSAPGWGFSAEPTEGVDLIADDLATCLEKSRSVQSANDDSYMNIYGKSFELLLERNRGLISTSTVRRDVLELAGGFPDGLTCAEDWTMYVNVARFEEWHFLDQRLSFIRNHGGQNTRQNITNGVVTLRAIRRVWEDRDLPVPIHRPLSDYGSHYRWLLQRTIWTSCLVLRLDLAVEGIRVGWPLLPRWRDRIYSVIPSPITWRIERLAERFGDYASRRS